jgi:hypothetical protein
MKVIVLAAMGILCLTAWVVPAPHEAQPQPRNAVDTMLSAFARVPVVAIGALHGDQTTDDFVLSLIRDPRFPATVRNIAFECGNSRYQDVLDRYVAGDDVALSQAQLAWRNTTQVFGCNEAEQQRFVDAVRELNRHQPSNRRIRVLAGDPPIDWAEAHTSADIQPFLAQRNTNFATVVEREVLAKHEKALLLIGDLHIVRKSGSVQPVPTITMLLESTHPHSTYVVIAHHGFSTRNAELEPRLANWPWPSIATVRGTWLASLDPFLIYDGIFFRGQPVNPFPGLKLEELTDAYLYLGPAASLREVDETPETDTAYARELARRRALFMGRPKQVTPAPTSTP